MPTRTSNPRFYVMPVVREIPPVWEDERLQQASAGGQVGGRR